MSTNEPLKPCPLGCVDSCKAKEHGCASECPSPNGVGRPAAIPTGEGLKPKAWARPRKNSDDMFSVMSPEDKEEFGDAGHAVRHSVPLYTADQLSRLASSTGAQAEAVSDWLKKQKRFGWTKGLVEHLEKTGWPSDKMMVEEDTIGQFIMHTYYPEIQK